MNKLSDRQKRFLEYCNGLKGIDGYVLEVHDYITANDTNAKEIYLLNKNNKIVTYYSVTENTYIDYIIDKLSIYFSFTDFLESEKNQSIRKDYISNWDDYFMNIAELTALRSKDENSKVGAVIVNNENKIISVGYNGFPTGIDESQVPHGRCGDFLNTKYPYVVHAEANAIINGSNNYKDCRLYVTLFPCNECAKLVCQSGIKEVIYLSDKYKDSDNNIAARKLFDLCGISYRKIEKYESLKSTVNRLITEE